MIWYVYTLNIKSLKFTKFGGGRVIFIGLTCNCYQNENILNSLKLNLIFQARLQINIIMEDCIFWWLHICSCSLCRCLQFYFSLSMFSSQHKNSIDQDSSNQQNEEVKTVDQTTVFFLVRNNSNKYEDIPNTDKLGTCI